MNIEQLLAERALIEATPIPRQPDETLSASDIANWQQLRSAGYTDEQIARRRAVSLHRRSEQLAREEAEEARARDEQASISRRIDPRLRRKLESCPSPCGLLLGPSGIGKTAAMDWLAVRQRGYFVHARELASAERRHGLGAGYPPEIHRARTTRVLYLDDVGAEEQRDLGTLQAILDHRYRKGIATFATSGLRSSELQAHLGAAYVRRLVDQHVKRDDGCEWPVLFVDLFAAEAS